MSPPATIRGDLRHVAGLIPQGARVLDVGCGDGALLEYLRDRRGCEVRGIELSPQGVAACVRRGISCIQADIDEGLSDLPDSSFGVVVLSQTLQVVHAPALALDEVVRVGEIGIVSFPNFAHWRVRGFLALRGRMPVSRAIPYDWHDTPNIHHTTIKDFRRLCSERGISLVDEIPLVTGTDGAVRPVSALSDWRADTEIAVLAKSPRRDTGVSEPRTGSAGSPDGPEITR